MQRSASIGASKARLEELAVQTSGPSSCKSFEERRVGSRTHDGSDNCGCVACSTPKVGAVDGFVKPLVRFEPWENRYSLAVRAFKLE